MSEIVLENVQKVYPGSDSPAVKNTSITFESGKITVILGSSGCGKTTLLKMINRLYEQTEGTIFIDGKSTREMPVNELRRGIGYVIQQSGLFPHMSVSKNIGVVPEMLDWDKERINQRIEELLELVHMDPKEFRNRYPRQLSGGQQQRVGLARALAADPPIMLMDEPFGAIDAITRHKLQKELINIQRKLKKTILFVTHDVDEAILLADKIVVMTEGEVVQYDTPLNLISQPANDFVKSLLGGEDVIRQLSLINVTFAMQDPGEIKELSAECIVSYEIDLKSALEVMLKTNQEKLYIVNDEDIIIGKLRISDFQSIFSS